MDSEAGVAREQFANCVGEGDEAFFLATLQGRLAAVLQVLITDRLVSGRKRIKGVVVVRNYRRLMVPASNQCGDCLIIHGGTVLKRMENVDYLGT